MNGRYDGWWIKIGNGIPKIFYYSVSKLLREKID